jgi:hypothetical protein
MTRSITELLAAAAECGIASTRAHDVLQNGGEEALVRLIVSSAEPKAVEPVHHEDGEST